MLYTPRTSSLQLFHESLANSLLQMNIEDLTLTKGDNCSIISKAAKSQINTLHPKEDFQSWLQKMPQEKYQPNTWKCPNFEPLTMMCSPVCSQEMGAAMTAPTFTYTHQPLYIVVICLIFSEVPMYSYHYAMSPHKQNYQTKCPCNPNNALVVNKFHLKQNKRKNVPKKKRCKRDNCSKFDACTFSVSSKRRWNTIKRTLRQTINADGLVLSVAWFDIVTSWVKSDAAINRLSYKITIANLTSIESNEIHP